MTACRRRTPGRNSAGPSSRDAGFTLIEIMVAMGMAAVVLTAFAYASSGSIRAMQGARLNQQAADLATQRIESVRTLAWGRLGHDPTGIAPDPHLIGASYGGEPLVKVTGGLKPQIATVTQNSFTYTVYTYVTVPVDNSVANTDSRRVSVVVEWAAYGQQHSRTMSTIVTLTQRGLPLPEFKLTPVGPTMITVNPDATAAFGYQLSNQGAPDQWNITSTLAGATIYLDNGDDVYDAATDTSLMADHNGDGTPDSGRLEPKASMVFWVVRQVPASAPDGTTTFSVTAQPVGSGTGTSESVSGTLVVTHAVITASATPSSSSSASTSPSASPTGTSPTPTSSSETKCAPSNPAPTPSAVSGYSVREYVLHNSGATSWPALPLPLTGVIPGTDALRPMYMDMSPVSIPADRDLPVLSKDIDAATTGRLLRPGGSFTSTSAGDILDFLIQNPNSYTGSVVLRMWTRPATAGQPVRLSAQVYRQKTNGTQAVTTVSSEAQLAIDPFTCAGWQEVWFSIPVTTFTAGKNNVVGIRVWNTGAGNVRLAYDHGAFPAVLRVVEK